jgi:uncharacterized protein YbjT (DUF2867 family)
MRSNKIMNSPKNPTLVVGGTGKTGRRIVDRLQKLGLPVHVGSRSAHPPFDWEDRSTWRPALDGATQAYVSYYPDICVPGALETLRSFFREALSAGVTKLVLLSGRGEPEAEQVENALRATNAEWTILRCSFFSQNFSESFLLDPIMAGEVALPIGSVAEPFVDAEDIADVAVAALTQAGHSRKLYELTGPRALTFEQAVAEISHVTKAAHTLHHGQSGRICCRDAACASSRGRNRSRSVPVQHSARRPQHAHR